MMVMLLFSVYMATMFASSGKGLLIVNEYVEFSEMESSIWLRKFLGMTVFFIFKDSVLIFLTSELLCIGTLDALAALPLPRRVADVLVRIRRTL